MAPIYIKYTDKFHTLQKNKPIPIMFYIQHAFVAQSLFWHQAGNYCYTLILTCPLRAEKSLARLCAHI